jgi:hypothetical protein
MGASEGAECIHNSLINLYRSEPKNIYKFSSYFKENSSILHYEDYSVRIVFKTSIINLRVYIHSVDKEHNFLVLKQVVLASLCVKKLTVSWIKYT